MSKFWYFVFTNEKVCVISSRNEIDIKNENQIAWIERMCDGRKPIAIMPITKENGHIEMSIESMKRFIIWIEQEMKNECRTIN